MSPTKYKKYQHYKREEIRNGSSGASGSWSSVQAMDENYVLYVDYAPQNPNLHSLCMLQLKLTPIGNTEYGIRVPINQSDPGATFGDPVDRCRSTTVATAEPATRVGRTLWYRIFPLILH